MRHALAVAVLALAAAPLPAANSEPVPLARLNREPGQYEGKIVQVRAQVSGTVVEEPKWVWLTVKGRKVTVPGGRVNRKGINFVVAKEDKDQLLSEVQPGRFRPATITATIKKERAAWLAVVSAIEFGKNGRAVVGSRKAGGQATAERAGKEDSRAGKPADGGEQVVAAREKTGLGAGGKLQYRVDYRADNGSPWIFYLATRSLGKAQSAAGELRATGYQAKIEGVTAGWGQRLVLNAPATNSSSYDGPYSSGRWHRGWHHWHGWSGHRHPGAGWRWHTGWHHWHGWSGPRHQHWNRHGHWGRHYHHWNARGRGIAARHHRAHHPRHASLGHGHHRGHGRYGHHRGGHHGHAHHGGGHHGGGHHGGHRR